MKRVNVFFKMVMVLTMAFAMVSCQQGELTQIADDMEKEEKMSKGRVAVLVADGFHDGEAYMPMGFLLNNGFDITVIGPEPVMVTAYNSDFTIQIERSVRDVTPDDFDALVLPGGKGPALLREIPEVVDFVAAFNETGKPIAAICHGPQVLITAGLVEGMTCTGVSGIQDELEEAGATYIDEPLVISNNIITSRVPKDLYPFSNAIVEALSKK